MINDHTYIGKRLCPTNKIPETDKYMSSSYILHGRGKYNIVGAFEKYGKQNFKKEILISGDYTQEEINEFEKYYIWLAKAVGKAEYNIAKGGDGGYTGEIWNKGKTWSSEIRKRISETNKKYCGEKHSQFGTHRSNETKKRMSESLTGKYRGVNNKNFGRPHSEEWNEKMRSSLRGKYIGEKSAVAKKIVCINTNQTFISLTAATKWALKCSLSGLSHALKSNTKQCGRHPETGEKLYWRLYENK
jgi:group I intron endonuclease